MTGMPIIQQSVVYECRVCNRATSVWSHVCPSCNRKGTYTERPDYANSIDAKIFDLSDNTGGEEERFSSGVPGFDVLTGGGIPFGSVIIFGGDPGAGKSTLTLEVAVRADCESVLLISGEEIMSALKGRARRMGLQPNPGKTKIMYSTDTDEVISVVRAKKPKLLILDSLQAFTSMRLQGVAGSPGQIRRLVLQLVKLAKEFHIAMILIGQVNQDGTIAGPQKAKHWVDGVAMLSRNERTGLRTGMMQKSRFAPSHIRVPFVMTHQGLKDQELSQGLTLEGQAPDSDVMSPQYQIALAASQGSAVKRASQKKKAARSHKPSLPKDEDARNARVVELFPNQTSKRANNEEVTEEEGEEQPSPKTLREAADILARRNPVTDDSDYFELQMQEQKQRERADKTPPRPRGVTRLPERSKSTQDEPPLPENVDDFIPEGF